jgi:iron only hydrogenase large subunit-like protein
MMGAIIKSYYAEKHGLNKEDIYVVSVMPCIAKKGEKEREANRVESGEWTTLNYQLSTINSQLQKLSV